VRLAQRRPAFHGRRTAFPLLNLATCRTHRTLLSLALAEIASAILYLAEQRTPLEC
jgi:hypothetical protein